MSTILCNICHCELNVQENLCNLQCEHCGNTVSFSEVNNEKVLEYCRSARSFCQNKEFEKAVSIYEKFISEFPNESSGYWGMVLAKFGIEYVHFPEDNMIYPLWHKQLEASFLDDTDYIYALEIADDPEKEIYRNEAERIAAMRQYSQDKYIDSQLRTSANERLLLLSRYKKVEKKLKWPNELKESLEWSIKAENSILQSPDLLTAETTDETQKYSEQLFSVLGNIDLIEKDILKKKIKKFSVIALSLTVVFAIIFSLWSYNMEAADLRNGNVCKIKDNIVTGVKYDKKDIFRCIIPDGVTAIAPGAFAGCLNLHDVTIPDGVTAIARGAFVGCLNLHDVTIPASVKTIGEAAFALCGKLNKITIPGGIKKIKDQTFAGCHSLQTVMMGEGVIEIGDEAFAECRIRAIEFPDSVKTFGKNIFDGSSLEKVIIPWDANFKRNTFPENCTVIPIGAEGRKYVSAACNGNADAQFQLGKIYYDRSIYYEAKKWLQKSAARKNSEARRLLEAAEKKSQKDLSQFVLGYDSRGLILRWCKNKDLITCNIPNGITKIEPEAFLICRNLRRVTIPDSVYEIGEKAFGGLHLQEIIIPANVRVIGDGAFYNAQKVILRSPHFLIDKSGVLIDPIRKKLLYAPPNIKGSYQINRSVTKISAYAFFDARKLHEIIIPEGVTEIGEMAFANCSSLKSVSIPSSVKKTGWKAFASCHALQKVVFQYGITEIGVNQFNGCGSLKEVVIPPSVRKVGHFAFSNCALKKITIPDSVTEIGQGAFMGCRDLEKVIIPRSVTKIGRHLFDGCKKLQYVEINGEASFDTYTFQDCQSLKEVRISHKCIIPSYTARDLPKSCKLVRF